MGVNVVTLFLPTIFSEFLLQYKLLYGSNVVANIVGCKYRGKNKIRVNIDIRI